MNAKHTKKTKQSTQVAVPLSLLKRLLPLVIEGNNAAIEGFAQCDSDSSAEMKLERLIEKAKERK